MKKLIIAACTATLFSGAAMAGPNHKQGHAHKHAVRHYQQHDHHPHQKPARRNHHRDLFNFALFVGTALAIDAALDHHHDNKPYAHGPHTHGPAKPRPKPYVGKANINQRQVKQAKRIKQGVRSGELVKAEAKKLREQQRRIARLEANFRADGHLSKKERKIIQAKLDNASERIYALKHNHRTSY